MKILALFTILVLSLSCSKEVSSKDGSLTVAQPPIVALPNISGTLSLSFANHATIQDPVDELSNFFMPQAVTVTVPSALKISYSSSPTKPNLSLTVNNTVVCVYIWTSGQYVPHSSCYSTLQLTANDMLWINNIPRAETVSTVIQYQK